MGVCRGFIILALGRHVYSGYASKSIASVTVGTEREGKPVVEKFEVFVRRY
jgi:hypothetical protein